MKVDGQGQVKAGSTFGLSIHGEVAQHVAHRGLIHRRQQGGQLTLKTALEHQHGLAGQHIRNLALDHHQGISQHARLPARDRHPGAIEPKVDKGAIDDRPLSREMELQVFEAQTCLKAARPGRPKWEVGQGAIK